MTAWEQPQPRASQRRKAANPISNEKNTRAFRIEKGGSWPGRSCFYRHAGIVQGRGEGETTYRGKGVSDDGLNGGQGPREENMSGSALCLQMLAGT